MLLLCAVAVGLIVATTAPANATVYGFGQASMTIAKNDLRPGYHTIGILGYVTTSQAEAQGLINAGYWIKYSVWGEDTFDDDHILNAEALTIWAAPEGLRFASGIGDVLSSRLDEDWGRDELYIKVWLEAPNGAVYRAAETNRVYGYF
jgi:hypothetical protein